ncbi:thiol-activated cytolysin family protein [Couchioplanes azureus]|uniref:thiol-activated cytolysin family protein n=1 Tax=Couchioplanes caeruleus TaxID=56438 RepID=UPI0016713617|nr:thiol-activated cytolysin family protein [Couchioplanes caeruleus]GGQ60479.1 hypothetical protein GCM10010166_32630 [Couchioplanes caeruleus subsp. azureus]
MRMIAILRVALVATLTGAIVSGVSTTASALPGTPAVAVPWTLASGGKPTQADAVNRYILRLRALTARPAADNPTGPTSTSTEVVDQTKYECQTTPRTLTANPSEIISLNADRGKLWLGALLQGSGYAGGPGSLAELPIRDRAPLTIYADLPGKRILRKVKLPTGARVQQAINDVVADAHSAQIEPPAAYDYDRKEAQSSEEALLKAGISVKYLGARANASLKISRKTGESSILVTLTQRMFTVNIVKPATPAEYFGRKYTLKDLKKQAAMGRIGRSNPPVVVSQIVYGRKLIYTVTAKSSAQELDAAVSLVVSGNSAELSLQQKALISSARYSVVAVGGEDSAVRKLIAEHKINEYLAQKNSLLSAVPISYQVDNVVKDSAAAFSETTNYNLTTCSVIPVEPVVVGDVVKLENLRGDVTGPCEDPALYGTLFINGENVWDTEDEEPYAGPPVRGEFTFPDLGTPTATPLPPAYRHTMQNGEFALFHDGSTAIRISGSIVQSVWIGKYPVNLYDTTMRYPNLVLGQQTIEGGSVHCKVNLRFELKFVKHLYDYGDAP